MGRARKSPREGAEDGVAAICRPVPGLREPRGFATDHAMGNFHPLLRASIRSIPRPPPFKSHAQFGLSYCSAACRMRIMFGGADDRFLSSAAAAGLEEAGHKQRWSAPLLRPYSILLLPQTTTKRRAPPEARVLSAIRRPCRPFGALPQCPWHLRARRGPGRRCRGR